MPPSPLRVLYLITKSNWGGAQRYVYDLAAAAGRHGIEAVVALGGTGAPGAPAGTLADRLREAHVRTIFVRSLARDVSFFGECAALVELVLLVRRERPDVLHLNSSKAGGLGALAARLMGVRRIVFTVHGWPFEEARSALIRALIWIASWLTALMSHVVIVVSDYDLKVARRMPFVGRKAIRIYNGIDLTAPFGSGESVRSAFLRGVRITGTIGELNANKNHAALVAEAARDSSMHVAIVGEGELHDALAADIRARGLSERVKLLGFIPASEALKGFDEFALPSRKEGLPYVLIEARAAGLPVRANRVGGVGEILDAADLQAFALPRMITETYALYRGR